MIPAVLFFLVLVSPPLFGAVRRGKRFEETIALTAGGLVLLLFLCGILGILKPGVYLVLGITAAFLVLSAAEVFRKRTSGTSPLKTLAPFCTPAALAFLLVYVFLLYVHYTRMAHEWDEFTHWGDVVKAMCHIDDFSTSPLSHSRFQNYVPGMALFQYLFEKIAMILPDGIFVDWRLYFAYHLLAFIFLLPFMTVRKWRFFLPAFLMILFTALSPSLLTEGNYLTTIYIDGFVGLLAGAGFAALFLEKPSRTKTAHILVTCAVLVLAKDVGMVFAVVLGIAFLITERPLARKSPKKFAGVAVLTAAAVAVPKLLWNLNVKINGATSVKFTKPIDFGVLWNVITGKETGDIARIPGMCFEKLLKEPIGLEGTFRVSVTYPVIAAVLLLLLCGLWLLWRKKDPEAKFRRAVSFWAMIFTFILYCVGLPVIYMFKFSANTALPSFERYMSIVFTCWTAMAFLLLAAWAQESPKQAAAGLGVCLAAGLLTLNPVRMREYVTRKDIADYYNTPRFYSGLVDAMNEIAAGEEKHVWIICQETDGFEYWPIRYGIRPCNAELNVGWSLSAASPPALYPGDRWTLTVTAEEWREQLKDYDYVLVYKANDSFRQDYAALFKDPGEIEDSTIFAVNHETGLLERVWITI